MMLYTIAIVLFLLIMTFAYILLQFIKTEKPVMSRLEAYEQNEVQDFYADEELSKSLYERLIAPAWHKISAKLGNLTPRATYAMFDEKIKDAGGFRNMNTNSFLLFWFASAFFFTFLAWILSAQMFHQPNHLAIRVAVAVFIIVMLLPILVLNQRIRKRREEMQKSLPGILDLIYVSVQAGLAFDGAISKVTEKMHGPLVEELSRMLQELRVGVTRKMALKNLSDRCKIQDISLFTAALIQADQLGVAIANVLKIQAANVRVKRQLSIRELALKAPVKILIPLVFFIFPAVFVVLLGPGAILILRQFLQM